MPIRGEQLDANTIDSSKVKTDEAGGGGALSTIEAGDSAAEGSGLSVAKRDHQHAIDTATGTVSEVQAGDAAAEGTALGVARKDHIHNIDTSNGAISEVQAGDAAVEGSGTGLSRRDHQHSVATGAAGSILIGDSAAEGASADLARADHTHALAAPGAPADVTKAAASAGVATAPARADHKHDVSTAIAVAIGTANAEGSATSLSRSDHTHDISSAGKTAVLASKLFAFGLQADDYDTAAASSDSGVGSANAIVKKVIDASKTARTDGSASARGTVTTAPDNAVAIRDRDTNDPLQDGSNRQIFARLTSSAAALSGTWTWSGGSTTVASDDTSGVSVGDFISLPGDNQFFEITSITPNTSVVIINPKGLVISAGSGANNLTLTLSYLVESAPDTEIAHTFGASENIDLVFSESLGIDEAPFNTHVSGGTQFHESLSPDHTHILSDVTDVTATAGEVNVLSGFTGTTGELNEVTDGSDVARATHHHDAEYPTKTTLTTKGDLYVRDGSTVTRIGVGADGQVLTADSVEATGVKWAAGGGGGNTFHQENVTTETITNSDTALADTLNNTPTSNASVALYLNGVFQEQGAGKDYSLSGSTITWLASSGTAVNMKTTDVLVAMYAS